MVGNEGLEPSLHCWNQILSLARLPVPPVAHVLNYNTKNPFYGIINYMDNNSGGLSSLDRQRQTAAEIARKRVLAAYSHAAQTATQTTIQTATQPTAQPNPAAQNQTYKQAPSVQSQPQRQDWQKYHSAWQNYYQKYYSDYYAKAASQYIATEKLRLNRAHDDAVRGTQQPQVATQPAPQPVSETLKDRIRKKASTNFRLKRHHKRLIPIFAGVFAVLLILFLQYNRLIFAPIMAYISPGNVDDTGITALDPTVSGTVGSDPLLIIPKLNIEVPVNYGISNDEATVMNAMNNGVAHWAIPGADALPGQNGTVVITGHSAGDIYSNNQYKFIFSGLERLTDGDLIYLNYNSVRYTYSVYKKQTVEPTDVAALTSSVTKPTLILVTCTPLGTSRYRLLVFAEQVSPAVTTTEGGSESSGGNVVDSGSTEMPSNEPGFFESIWNWLTGQ